MLPALFAGEFVAAVNKPSRFYHRALLGNIRFNVINVLRNIHAVDHRLFVGVFADDVLIEEPEGAFVGGGGEADQKGIKIVEHLFPKVVNGAVALINDDEVKLLNRHVGRVVHKRHLFLFLLFDPRVFRWIFQLGAFVELFAFQNGVEPLDG